MKKQGAANTIDNLSCESETLRSTRFERATYGFEVRCSIQLSYERKRCGRWGLNPRQPDPQSGALPTELRPPQLFNYT